VTLLEQVQRGDRAGWQRLMDLYRPLVLWWCRGKVAPPADAEDVAQEVFKTVAARVADFHKPAQGGGFRAWLRTITRHKLGDHLRRAHHAPAAAGGDAQEILGQIPATAPEEADAEDPLERRILYRRALELVRGEVEARTWEAVWRTAVDGQRPADVAADLGITPGAVYSARSRVFARLREELAGLLD
jgi:RNA polymerase sigma-70 factor (ECF subfamily)